MTDGPVHPEAVLAPGLFAGKTALVTGGSRGIGLAVASTFARLGASLVIASNDPGDLEAARAQIEGLGAQCLGTETNIRDVESVEALRAAANDRFGGVDFIINN